MTHDACAITHRVEAVGRHQPVAGEAPRVWGMGHGEVHQIDRAGCSSSSTHSAAQGYAECAFVRCVTTSGAAMLPPPDAERARVHVRSGWCVPSALNQTASCCHHEREERSW
jgi:hypothetical protein